MVDDASPRRPIRVLLTHAHELPKSILRSLIARETTIEVIPGDDGIDVHVDDPEDLLDLVHRHRPDVLVIGARDDAKMARVATFLGTPVILVSARGRDVRYQQLEPRGQVIHEVSVEQFLDLLRGADGGRSPSATA